MYERFYINEMAISLSRAMSFLKPTESLMDWF